MEEEIIIASNNQGKIKEIKEIMKDKKVMSLQEAGVDIEVEEDKDTFEGNALKKAKEITKITGKTCIADDSGLCIAILNEFPGVKTKRFLGENATRQQRNEYILDKLKGLPKESRKAKSVTCIAMTSNNGEEIIFRGELTGYISEASRGSNGFGYDDIFELEDGKTLAELSLEEKNKVSSRSKALKQIEDYLHNSEKVV